MSSAALFLTAAAIWGSTWLVIKFQLGVVAPEISVVYRFALASLLLVGGCVVIRQPLKFAARNHLFFAGLGLLMIALNYVFVYRAEQVLTSGLVAVLYSTMVYMMPIAMRVAFGVPLKATTFVAATLCVGGIAFLFLPELDAARKIDAVAQGVAYSLAAVLVCCIGNLIVVRNHNAGIPTIPATAWSFVYGTAFVAVWALCRGEAWTFDTQPAYVLSLAYLAVFGSVVAFVAYFTLVKRVGAGPSAYVQILTPVIAMLLSTLVEGYRWNLVAVFGVLLAVLGNWIALTPAARNAHAEERDPATRA